MMWQLRCVLRLPYLLAATAIVFPPVLSRPTDDGPLQAVIGVQSESPTPGSIREWGLPPNPNSTHHLIFNSVSGLLQRWPNALRRNGHSLVPATVPKGTILYHGRADHEIPTSADWLAFDFDHAYLFCRESCHMVSVQAKRDLRVVYFDGLSAAKRKDGTLDSQDVLLWGRPEPGKYYSETERLESLCEWGRPLGLDGFVRMEFNFELMICDFTGPVELVSVLEHIPLNQTTIPERLPGIPFPIPWPHPPRLPSGWRGSPPSMRRGVLEGYLTGIWHDRVPGETRVRPDYSGLVTFYDPSLTSLIDARHGKDKLHLRLAGISALDAERVRAELRTVLTRAQDGGGSGIDWGGIVHAVTERYADRLEYLRFLLSPNATAFADEVGRAAAARAQLLVMLVPYITTADVPRRLPASADLTWAAPIALRCATTQTSHIPRGMLTPQEARIHAAVENTLHEICRRLVLVWVEFFDVEAVDEAKATETTDVARGHIEELMAWLDWSVWVRCEPGCGLGEFCYFPSWPYFEGEDPFDLTPRCRSFETFARRSGVSPARN